jgi:hypothetical protein
MMGSEIDRALVEEITGGDPLLIPHEAAGMLGLTVKQLGDLAAAKQIPSIQAGKFAQRRYRTSDVAAYKAAHGG